MVGRPKRKAVSPGKDTNEHKKCAKKGGPVQEEVFAVVEKTSGVVAQFLDTKRKATMWITKTAGISVTTHVVLCAENLNGMVEKISEMVSAARLVTPLREHSSASKKGSQINTVSSENLPEPSQPDNGHDLVCVISKPREKKHASLLTSDSEIHDNDKGCDADLVPLKVASSKKSIPRSRKPVREGVKKDDDPTCIITQRHQKNPFASQPSLDGSEAKRGETDTEGFPNIGEGAFQKAPPIRSGISDNVVGRPKKLHKSPLAKKGGSESFQRMRDNVASRGLSFVVKLYPLSPKGYRAVTFDFLAKEKPFWLHRPEILSELFSLDLKNNIYGFPGVVKTLNHMNKRASPGGPNQAGTFQTQSGITVQRNCLYGIVTEKATKARITSVLKDFASSLQKEDFQSDYFSLMETSTDNDKVLKGTSPGGEYYTKFAAALKNPKFISGEKLTEEMMDEEIALCIGTMFGINAFEDSWPDDAYSMSGYSRDSSDADIGADSSS